MICPKCSEEMLVIEYRQIELDFCPKCKGLWFDRTELQLLMKICGLADEKHNQFSLEYFLNRVVNQQDIPLRKCPMCNHKMTLVNAGKDDRIIIDICPRNDGIWFDGGELAQLIRQEISSSDIPKEASNVLSYLQETLKYVS